MSKIDDILEQLEQLIDDRRTGESVVFSSRSYSDQPLIQRGSDYKARMKQRDLERAARRKREAEDRRKRREAARAASPHRDDRPARTEVSLSFNFPFEKLASTLRSAMEPLPDTLNKLRKLEGAGMPSSIAYGSTTMSSLFYRQAKIAEAYEDTYDFRGGFSQYYPTYAAMSDHQLRGYFSWRTRVRSGQVDPAPLSFAFVYVYELLCGIGVTDPRAGLQSLRQFGSAYRETDAIAGNQLASYLNRWTYDYAIYHGLTDELAKLPANEIGGAVITLLRAERAVLARSKLTPRIENPASTGTEPDATDLLQALSDAGTYHIATARLAKDEPALVAAVAAEVFSALVLHCAKRRKTDYVEGLFGYATNQPYTMFPAAVFYDPDPHPDAVIQVGKLTTYTCTDGRWRRLMACEATKRNSELGLAMHAVDYELRQALSYAYPLKPREVPKYLKKYVCDAVAKHLKAREEAEARRITIDRSKLGSIRAAATLTQEALLTDEERDLPEREVTPPAPKPPEPQARPEATPPEAGPSTPASEATAAPAAASLEPTVPAAFGLNDLEATFLRGLLRGTPASDLLSPTDPFPSVVADAINEKLFDLVGDTVIEFEDDEPHIIEDYLDDVREALSP